MPRKTDRFLIFPLLMAAAALAVLSAGCGLSSRTETEVARIVVIHGDEQCTAPGTECPQEICLEFLGPLRRGLLGGKGRRRPVPGVRPVFETVNAPDLEVLSASEVSDAGGYFRLKLKLGQRLGDQYLRVTVPDFPAATRNLRMISGVRIAGEGQETFSGKDLPEPIRVVVYDDNGRPKSGVPVYFSITGAPEYPCTATCHPPRMETDADGRAESRVRMGRKTGLYRLMIEVASDDRQARGIEIPIYARNLWGLTGLIVSVLGGLAIFIFGMKSMTDGLQLIAGEKMRKVLQYVTRNSLAAVLAGTAVTGIIQSSSACTVMTVGFVNAGLLSLQQAIGIVFGANIGTTVTAQIISFNLAAISLPAITVGLLIMLLSRRVMTKGWGQTLLGFGMLFFGMEMMSTELKQVAVLPSVITFFRSFDCTPAAGGMMPLGAVLGAIGIGTLMTVIIQSSSATIGIALALAASGLINFYTAVPLILGDNIGTTITANLAAIGANQPARQTGVAHFLFNAIGATFMLLLFYVPWGADRTPIYLYFINQITPGNVFAPEPENITRHIAMAHTMFNFANVLVFLPMIPLIARICRWLIPDPVATPLHVCRLEPHLLNTPSIALEQVIMTIRQMTTEAWDMVRAATEAQFLTARHDPDQAVALAEREEGVDRLQGETIDYLVRLSTRRLTEPQAEIIPLLIHCVNDAERIADHTDNIITLAQRLAKAKHKFIPEAETDLRELWQLLCSQADHVIAGLSNTGREDATMALAEEHQINQMSAQLEKRHVARMKKGKSRVPTGIIFLEMVGEMEKIGDRFTNIADRTPEIQRHHLAIHDDD